MRIKEANYFTLPQYIVADAGYGSEQNYDDGLNERDRLPITSIKKRRKRSLRTIHLKQTTGNMEPKRIHLFVQIIADYILPTNRIEMINMDLHEPFRCMNVKTVSFALYVPYVQKQQKVKTRSCFIMENGNLKKNT